MIIRTKNETSSKFLELLNFGCGFLSVLEMENLMEMESLGMEVIFLNQSILCHQILEEQILKVKDLH